MYVGLVLNTSFLNSILLMFSFALRLCSTLSLFIHSSLVSDLLSKIEGSMRGRLFFFTVGYL